VGTLVDARERFGSSTTRRLRMEKKVEALVSVSTPTVHQDI